MREAGRKLAGVLRVLEGTVAVGVQTVELDRLALARIKEAGAEAAFLNYRPEGAKKVYPATICVSINDVVVHGLPSGYRIQVGDLVKLDLGLVFKGFYVDTAATVLVRPISPEAERLVSVTKEALRRAVAEAKIGKTLGDVGAIIQKTAESAGFSILKSLTGHGIGRSLHEDPVVLNFGRAGEGEALREGMVIAIEPMIGGGRPPQGERVKQLSDDSFVTADRSPSAHFEHTVAVTKDGPIVLTEA